MSAAGLLAGFALVMAWARFERSMNLEPPSFSRSGPTTKPAVAAGANIKEVAIEAEPEPKATAEDSGVDAGTVAKGSIATADSYSAETLHTADASIADAGADVWVKPEWAQPDDEPPRKWDPDEVAAPEDRNRSRSTDGPIENPY